MKKISSWGLRIPETSKMKALLTALLTVLYLYGLLNSVSAAGCDISANYGENLIIKKKLLVAGGGSADRVGGLKFKNESVVCLCAFAPVYL